MLQSWPTPAVVVALIVLFLALALLGVWRAAHRDPSDTSRFDAMASATLSLSMAGFTLVGSFAAYSLWNAETSRTALLGTEIASARALLAEASVPGTADHMRVRDALLTYALALQDTYSRGELASADMHGYDMMLDLSRELRSILPAAPTTASQQALEHDYESLVAAHDERTSQTRPLLPDPVFYALLLMAAAASYVAGRLPLNGSWELKITQVGAAVLVICSLMSVVIILDSPATAAVRSLGPLNAFISYLQSTG